MTNCIKKPSNKRKNRNNWGVTCFFEKKPFWGLLVLFFVLFSACTPSVSSVNNAQITTEEADEPKDTPTVMLISQTPFLSSPDLLTTEETVLIEETLSPVPPDTEAAPSAVVPSETPRPEFDPSSWKELPVIPEIPDHVKQIYLQGQQMGNNPQAFSKIGDCETSTTWYLTDFDMGPELFDLGPYEDLQNVIDYYSGSFERFSLAADMGFSTASILAAIRADPELCESNESPLACEYRIQNPSVALITMGTNDVSKIESFEKNMRQIIEFTIGEGVIPVLATKADNIEGDHEINEIIARLAYEYELPLWNFWAAVQPLYRHGLQDDQAHLTWAANNFGDAAVMQNAWPVRNLTALQMLDAVWKKVTEE